jgi:hypothetical protein
MNPQFCKVGTVRPKFNVVINSSELENNSVEQSTNNTTPINKLLK